MNLKAENQKLLQDLIDAGFDKEFSLKAIENAPEKNFDSCVEYIACLQTALEERKRRQEGAEFDELKQKKAAEEMDKELKEKEKQKLLDREYLNVLKEKIESDRKEREMKDSAYTSGEIMKTCVQKIETSPDDCRIRIRYEDGTSKVYTYNKTSDLTELFNVAKEHFGVKNVYFYDTNFIEIKNEAKTLEKAGFWPSKIIIAKKK